MAKLSTLISQLTFAIIGIALCASPDLEFADSTTVSIVSGGKYLDDSCIDKCNVTDRRIDCNGCIPNDIYPTVNEIVVTDFNGSDFFPHMFCGVSWPGVHNLSIVNDIDWLVPKYDINNFTFECLHGIKTLKLKLPRLMSFSQKALFGLENVMILDLTGCVRLEIPGLSMGLSLDASIPKLQTIILRAMGSAFDGIQLSQDIIDSLAQRKVRNIDMSYTTVEFGKPLVNLDQLCKCMETWSLANSRIIHSIVELTKPCYSLRILNLSGVKFPRVRIPSGNMTIKPRVFQFDQKWFPFISYVSVIYLNNLISPDHYILIDNVTIHFSINSITEMHLSGYSIPLCGLKFRLDSNYLEYLDLSNNKIVRLNPDILDGLIYLKNIDLSKNLLGTSAQFHHTFSSLFLNNSKLEIVRLVQNELTYLPVNVFEFNTELKQIDLSLNKMMQITFEISHLYKLELLDLTRNAIEYLDDFSRQQIDIVYKNKQEKHNTTDGNSFIVDLRENAFSCKCHSMDFIKWFVHSPVFNGTKYLYYCTLDGKRTPMDKNAIVAAQYDCDKAKRKVRRMLLMVLLPCVSTGIVATLAIVAFKRYKRRKLYHRLRENIDLIHDDHLEYRFPVFLSYASEDSEFVEPNILQPLQVSLNAFLRV